MFSWILAFMFRGSMLSGTFILFTSNSNPAWNFSICWVWNIDEVSCYIVKPSVGLSSSKNQCVAPAEGIFTPLPLAKLDGILVYPNDYFVLQKILQYLQFCVKVMQMNFVLCSHKMSSKFQCCFAENSKTNGTCQEKNCRNFADGIYHRWRETLGEYSVWHEKNVTRSGA